MIRAKSLAFYALLTAFLWNPLAVLGEEPEFNSKGAGSCSTEPIPQETAQSVDDLSQDLFEIRLRNGMAFQLSRQAPTGMDPLAGHSSEKRELFFKRRKFILSTFARFLAFPRTFSSMEFIKGKIKGCFGKKSQSVAEELVQVSLGEKMAQASALQKSGYQIIAGILQTVDVNLWQDYRVLTKGENEAGNWVFGASAGVAALGVGVYGMKGSEYDFGYDNAEGKAYFKKSKLSQTLKDALWCAEALAVFGFFKQYQIDRTAPEEETRILALPFGLAYRSSSNTVSFGYLSGVSLTDVLGVVLVVAGQTEAAAWIASVGKTASLFSLYSTKAVRSEIPGEMPKWLGPAMRVIEKLAVWKKKCRDYLR